MVYFVKENGLDTLCVSLQLPALLIAAFPLVIFQKTKKTLKIWYCTIINALHLQLRFFFFFKTDLWEFRNLFRCYSMVSLETCGASSSLSPLGASLLRCGTAVACTRLSSFPCQVNGEGQTWAHWIHSGSLCLQRQRSLLQCGLTFATFYCHHS